MTQHKQQSPKMAKTEHRARTQGKSLRQLPEGLGIAMKMSVFYYNFLYIYL